jgi:hypothetical protein
VRDIPQLRGFADPSPSFRCQYELIVSAGQLWCRGWFVGTARDCAAAMTATVQRTGIRHLICMVEGAGDLVRVRENIARLGAEVLPLLPGRPAP